MKRNYSLDTNKLEIGLVAAGANTDQEMIIDGHNYETGIVALQFITAADNTADVKITLSHCATEAGTYEAIPEADFAISKSLEAGKTTDVQFDIAYGSYKRYVKVVIDVTPATGDTVTIVGAAGFGDKSYNDGTVSE